MKSSDAQQKAVELALQRIANSESVADLTTMEGHARKQGIKIVVDAAVKRKLKLAGKDISDPLEAELEEAVAAREHLLFLKHGKAQQASYTRRMMAGSKSAKAIITDWVMDTKPTTGFRDFVEAGIAEFAAENIAIRHAALFPPEVVAAAKRRLADFG
jgi:hypothetical protein